jgi:hypothetical protein
MRIAIETKRYLNTVVLQMGAESNDIFREVLNQFQKQIGCMTNIKKIEKYLMNYLRQPLSLVTKRTPSQKMQDNYHGA